MENMENNVVMNEAVVEAADVATNATIGQRVFGGFIGACAVVGATVIAGKAIKGIKSLIGKVKASKTNKQTNDIIVELDSEDVTE